MTEDKEPNTEKKDKNLPVKYVPPADDYKYPLLEDLAGTPEFKETLENICTNITNSEVFRMMASEPEKSYIFVGEPGTGKTFALKAIRNTIMGQNPNTGFMPYDIGKYGTAYINVGAVNLQKFFDLGRKNANDGFNVIYWFDEIDALMSKRMSSNSHKEDDKVLECLMKNLQNINSYGVSEYFFGATNFPDALDKAAIRSGRIDRIITFPKPDEYGIKKAYGLKINSANTSFNKDYGAELNLFNDINIDKIVTASEGFNYADIEDVVKRSLRNNALKVVKSPDLLANIPQITEKQVLYEIDRLRKEKYETTRRPIGYKLK